MASPYKINIPMYEGPLDLLLDLIKKQEMSIHDIQISQITSQYLDYLHKLEELNVDVSSEFIYMRKRFSPAAATLFPNLWLHSDRKNRCRTFLWPSPFAPKPA